eukprot:GHVR01165408.1.p1 GENE.GHVR01165408.1~~GHVR01165408.1.p1  ORF type:complete len:299 (+),score=21.24 GHVR01165408.1:37-897(+)
MSEESILGKVLKHLERIDNKLDVLDDLRHNVDDLRHNVDDLRHNVDDLRHNVDDLCVKAAHDEEKKLLSLGKLAVSITVSMSMNNGIVGHGIVVGVKNRAYFTTAAHVLLCNIGKIATLQLKSWKLVVTLHPQRITFPKSYLQYGSQDTAFFQLEKVSCGSFLPFPRIIDPYIHVGQKAVARTHDRFIRGVMASVMTRTRVEIVAISMPGCSGSPLMIGKELLGLLHGPSPHRKHTIESDSIRSREPHVFADLICDQCDYMTFKAECEAESVRELMEAMELIEGKE